MNRLLACLVLVPVVACAATDKAAIPAKAEPLEVKPLRTLTLRNPGFENAARPAERCAEHWDCTAHADAGSFRFGLYGGEAAEGKQVLCIDRVRKEPWALATTVVQAAELRGQRVRFSVAVRTDGEDAARIGPVFIAHGPFGVVGSAEKLTGKTAGWERHAIEAVVPQNAQLLEVGVQMQDGGRACADDARLEVMP